MASNRLALIAACFCALIALPCAFTSRLPWSGQMLDEDQDVTSFQGDLATLKSLISGWGSGYVDARKQQTVHVVTKFMLKPTDMDGFTKAWMDFMDATEKAGDATDMALTKPELNNLFFFECAEFGSMSDYLHHLDSDHLLKFTEWLADHNVIFNLRIVRRSIPEPRMKGKPTEDSAMFLVHYLVPPAEHESFIDIWEGVAKATWKEEGNHLYSLRKDLSNNVDFWGLGVWSDKDALLDHEQSDHALKLKEYTCDHDIVYFLMPLKIMGCMECGRK